MAVVVAVDAGTTGVRTLAVDEDGTVAGWAYREFPQYFPRPGWVEHDADDIWEAVQATLAELRAQLGRRSVAAIGVTNQRETVVAWDRRTGQPLHRAIVWQDRRTASLCEELARAGHLPLVRAATGLVLDPYFSATKMRWLLTEGGVEASPHLALGTVDSWLLWKLTGGTVHATDPSNASRTLLFDIRSRAWSVELCEVFGVPLTALPEVRPSSGRFAVTPEGTPVSGVAGDQQAALFGQACLTPGMTKATYGTGAFVLMNVGPACPPPVDGLLTSVAWSLADGTVAYALEGVFATGAAVQWLRDGLGVIATAAEVESLAATVGDTGGVVVVPAFTGLGSPWWDPSARAVVVGITRGTGRAHLARAVLEAVAHQTRDVVDAMASAAGRPVDVLRVDGGAAADDLLLQLVADQCGVPVARPRQTETTALGAAWLAGLAEGVWGSLGDVAACWALDTGFERRATPAGVDARHRAWHRAVERARGWAVSEPGVPGP